MIKKSTAKTDAGETTIWLVGGDKCSTCRITTFSMSESFAQKNRYENPIYDLNVSVWDFSDWGGKEVITNGTFSSSEVKEMLRKETVLSEVRDMLKNYFNIEISI